MCVLVDELRRLLRLLRVVVPERVRPVMRGVLRVLLLLVWRCAACSGRRQPDIAKDVRGSKSNCEQDSRGM